MEADTAICGYQGCEARVAYQLSAWFYHLLVCHDIDNDAAMYLLRERPPEPAALVVF